MHVCKINESHAFSKTFKPIKINKVCCVVKTYSQRTCIIYTLRTIITGKPLANI